jgi:hypothetical protein
MQPIIIEQNKLPVKIVAKNGFHFSKPKYIKEYTTNPILIGIGCEADNGRFWGGIVFSIFFFGIFYITGYYSILLLANLPLFFLFYKFFIVPNQFITVEILKP